MRLQALVIGLLSGAVLADMVKEGNVCTVTAKKAMKKRNWPPKAPPAPREEQPTTEFGILEEREDERYPRPDPALGEHHLARRQFGWGWGGNTGGGGQQASADDDTPAILDAFKQCGQDGHIILEEGDFMVRQVMNTSGLRNVHIDIYGRLEWPADNIQYWLSNSLSVTYAGRSTAWLMGGTNITMLGHGKALFFGNGQIWYDQNRNQGNQNGRPISLTLWYANDVWIDGITWRQSQFWHTFIAHSTNITMTNIDMNSTSATQWSTVNTDGTDTWNSKDIVLKNWTVTCGDDCISVKGNSTNVFVSNFTCYESGCAVIGSMGNPAYTPDYVDNIVYENGRCIHSSNAAWIKTYAGTGHVKNVTFRNIEFQDVNQPIYISPCIYTGQNCDNSRIPISDVTWENITGTSRYNIGAGIHCSASVPCENLQFKDVNITPKNGGQIKFLCSNIKNQATCGLGCTGSCPANWPQQLDGNR